jgi:hypothetical protein
MSYRQDVKELLELADLHLDTMRCPGGRIVMKGFICAHCGHDYTEDRACKKPRRAKSRPTPTDTGGR